MVQDMLELVSSPPLEIIDTNLKLQLFGNLLSNLEGMVYRCKVDEYWTMEFTSTGCIDLTGYRPEEIVLNGRISYEEITHPEDRELVREIVEEALFYNRRFYVEYRIVRRDGQIRWVCERGVAISGANAEAQWLEGFVQDITERKQAEEILKETERRYRSIFENAIEGIFQSTPFNGYIAVNPALARIYGYDTPQQLIAELRNIDTQLYVEPQRRIEFIRLMEKDGIVSNFESRIYTRTGKIIWISENARAVRNNAGKLLFYEGTVEDITERKRSEEEIQYRATHDSLTGLPNRTLLYDRIVHELSRTQRYASLMAVAFIDIDQFKYINDSLGHHIGDRLLKMVSSRLKSCVRDSDTVARQGGDEFVLVLTEAPDEECITRTMQRILAVVSKPWLIEGVELQVTCSIGVSLFPSDAHDADTLLKHADVAMFRAKELGRNNFQYFASEMNLRMTGRLEMLSALRHAISNKELLLHYQPKINLATKKLIGAEALIRWQAPDGGLILPGEFIPLAEETGLIIQIGEWALRAACMQSIAWQNAGYEPITVSVNISPLQLERGNFIPLIVNILNETGLPAHQLELEITESGVMNNVEKMLEILTQLREIGVKISIDDFGTGYSSLSYLKRFPIDTLKIDRSFIRDIAFNKNYASIVKAIITLGHMLNLNVLAEGVETEEEYCFLNESGCNEMQGYYLSKPLPVKEFTGFMTFAYAGN